ncbi:hypothetical protein MM221_02690 [Salipaludibacillus sp. LMS25]|jgi:hypothetical protein|uniref:hypothetical protein n=1 Tax=Salipaludibacillus sp. LMS25 TaxID=2924031 RepID=UPI0020D181D8|nr:hypothetical protein [Salipaludibacillus sp. LMS25]UTR15516.1 hypothetical protein MM221_02690 [Salipaludibacillus sp. LMS25]
MTYRDPSPISPEKPDYDKSKVNPKVANYTKQVREKQYGGDTREAMARTAEISSITSRQAKEKSEEAYEITQNLLDVSFDTAAINQNFEQRLDDKISNLQPEWTQFKDDTNEQLVQNQKEITNLGGETINLSNYNRLMRTPILMSAPEGFVFPFDLKIYDRGNGTFGLSHEILDIFPFEASLKTYYVDPVGGNDSNDGTSWESAWQTLGRANNESDCDVLEVRTGVYGHVSEGFRRPKNTNMKIISDGGKSIFFYGYDATYRTWTNEGGGCFSTSANIANMQYVADANNRNMNTPKMPVRLGKSDSISDCIATANTFFYDSSRNRLYIHTFDGRQPDRAVMITPGTGNPLFIRDQDISGDISYYFENWIFEGGANVTSNESSKRIFIGFKNCEFSYSETSNGLNVRGNVFSYCDSCLAEYNYQDGFNYHDDDYLGGIAVEVDCVGRFNGLERDTNIDNGSTVHDGISIIRVNGIYHENQGRNVHDIEDTMSWNVGCTSFNSVPHDEENAGDFVAWHNTKMWLYKCNAETIKTRDDAIIRQRLSFYDNAEGNIQEYSAQ